MPIVPDIRNTIYLGNIKNASQGIAANYRQYGNGTAEPAAPEGANSGYASLQSMYKTSPDKATWVSTSYIKPGEISDSYLPLNYYCMQTDYSYGNSNVGWTSHSVNVQLFADGGTMKNTSEYVNGAAFPIPNGQGQYIVEASDMQWYYAIYSYNNNASSINPQGIFSNNAGGDGYPNGEVGTFFGVDAGGGYAYLGNTVFYKMVVRRESPPQTVSLNTTVPTDGEIKMSNFYGQGNDTP